MDIWKYIINFSNETDIICRIVCIIKKVFSYEETKPPVIKYKDEIWVRAKTVPNILRYKNTMKSIRDLIDPEGKKNWEPNANRTKRPAPSPKKVTHRKEREKHDLYQRVRVIYSLILCSKLESAQVFKRWVTKERQEDTVMLTLTKSIMTV